MADARIDQLADAAKLVIETAANDPANVYVVCDDLPDLDPDPDGEGGGFPFRQGGPTPPERRWVCIMAPEYSDGGPASRGEDVTSYTFDILIAELYEGTGKVPLAWRRERTAWVKEKVYDTLSDARTPLGGTAYPDRVEVFNGWQELGEKKMFWSQVTITFIEHADAG